MLALDVTDSSQVKAAVAGADTPTVRGRIATELRDGGLNPAHVSVTVEPSVAGWGEPIRIRLATDEEAGIPFLGRWPIPMSSEFVTRSEVTH